MKATEQYFPVVLFIMLYKVVLTFESVYEISWCYHSNETTWAVCRMVFFDCKYINFDYYWVRNELKSLTCDENVHTKKSHSANIWISNTTPCRDESE